MAIEIVLDPPRRVFLRPVRDAARALVGGILFLAGLVASVPLVALFLPVLGIMQRLLTPVERRTPSTIDDWPVGVILAIWVGSVAITAVGLTYGQRIVRGKRRLVLFLRRFRYRAAREAVTYAVANSIGRSWRLVTLDDEETEPLGIPDTTRRWVDLAHLFRRIGALGGRTIQLIPEIAVIPIGGLWVIVVIDALGRPNWPEALLESFQRLSTPIWDSYQAGHLTRPLAADLESAFLVVAAAAIVLFALSVVAVAITLLSLVFLGPGIILGDVLGSVGTAQLGMRRRIDHVGGSEYAARAIEVDSRGILSPRLFVIRVASAAWREAVSRLARSSAAIIIDVSEPSENLIWEIALLNSRLGSTVVLIGELTRVQALAAIHGLAADPVQRRLDSLAGAELPRAELLLARLSSLLDGRSVLAYSTDRAGRRRFARALRDRLETLAQTPAA